MTKSRQVMIAKFSLIAILLAALIGVASPKLVPNVPVATVFLYCSVVLVAFFALIVVVSAVGIAFNQFILRNGGTDTQWFWFAGEPKGLQQLREQRVALVNKTD